MKENVTKTSEKLEIFLRVKFTQMANNKQCCG